uniref:Uncharacterized protein n=1 Tax=Anguilla anguilla TaxID=7936 RepID=A0A0E9TTX9_ANGAN
MSRSGRFLKFSHYSAISIKNKFVM